MSRVPVVKKGHHPGGEPYWIASWDPDDDGYLGLGGSEEEAIADLRSNTVVMEHTKKLREEEGPVV